MVENHIKHQLSNPYHPQSQGIVERDNRTIAERIRIYVYKKKVENWHEKIPDLVFAINCAPHSITKETPFYLLKGYDPRKSYENKYSLDYTNRDIIQDRKSAYEKLITQQQKVLKDRTDQSTPHPYKVGDYVLTRVMFYKQGTNKKTEAKYSRPYLVIGVNNASLKLLSKDAKSIKRVNCDRTKPYLGSLSRQLVDLLDRFYADEIDISEI